MKPITIGLVHFRTCDEGHFERAWYSVSRQDFTDVEEILVYDNNSGSESDRLRWIIEQCPVPVPWSVIADPHRDAQRTHPYSVNRLVDLVKTPWLLFTRSDYLLAFEALTSMWTEAQRLERKQLRPFVSGWCFQAAYDREQRDLPTINPDDYPWRTAGLSALTNGAVPGFCFHETDQDAGVWFTRPDFVWAAGGLNEKLSAWGYAQSTFQRALRHRARVLCLTIPRYLFFHQPHGTWARDFTVARQQYSQFGGGM